MITTPTCQQISIASNFLVRGGALVHFTFTVLGLYFAWPYTDFVWAITVNWVHVSISLVSRRHFFLESLTVLKIILLPLSYRTLRKDLMKTSHLGMSGLKYLTLCELFICSVLINIYYKNKILWKGMDIVLVSGYSNMALEVILLLYFSLVAY